MKKHIDRYGSQWIRDPDPKKALLIIENTQAEYPSEEKEIF